MADLLKRIGVWAYRVIPIISLVLASIALNRAYQTGRTLAKAGGYLTQISDNLTTRYIGQFPEFMPEIAKSLDEANREILIASDFPGYAKYSDHSAYVKYAGLVATKLTKPVNVRMVVLNEKERDRLTHYQFRDAKIEELKAPDNTRYQNFLRWSGRNPDEIRTVEDFVKALTAEQKRTLEEDFRGVTRKEYSGSMPVYLWIVDDKVAVFSIPSFSGGGALEGAFLTRDHRLISQLRNIFETYFSQSAPAHP